MKFFNCVIMCEIKMFIIKGEEMVTEYNKIIFNENNINKVNHTLDDLTSTYILLR